MKKSLSLLSFWLGTSLFAVDIGPGASGILNRVWEQLPQESFRKIREAACSIAGPLQNIDGLEITLAGDPMKYFPGLGYVIGTEASLSYSFLRQSDGTMVGQGYITPSVKAGYTTSAGDIRVGWTWGCQGNPDQRSGYFANVSIAGTTTGFGVDVGSIYANSVTGEEARPQGLAGLESRIQAASDLAATTEAFANGNSEVSRRYTSRNWFYQSATAELIQAAINESGERTFPKYATEHADNLKAILETHVNNNPLKAALNSLAEDLVFLRQLQRSQSQLNSEVSALFREVVEGRLTQIQSKLEGINDQVVAVYLPVFQIGRSWSVTGRYYTDLRDRYLQDIRSEQGYYTMLWVSDVLDSYRQSYEAIHDLLGLVMEWRRQIIQRDIFRASQTIGGIRAESIWRGCNYVSMTGSGLQNAGLLATAPLAAVGTVLNPFAAVGAILKLPFQAIRSLGQFREMARSAVTSTARTLNETTLGVSYQFQIPRTRFSFSESDLPAVARTSRSVSSVLGGVRSFFNFTCGESK